MEIQCVHCASMESAERTFCEKCGYPIRASTVSDFDDVERGKVFQDLYELLNSIKKELSADKYRDRSILKAFPDAEKFYLYGYLRPATTLWDIVVGRVLQDIDFTIPSLDLGCGDGTFSALFKGVQFSKKFDISAGLSFEKKDVFDTFDEGAFSKGVIQKASNPFSIGIDIKENLVKKAMEAGAYIETRVDDGVHLSSLEDQSLQSIWSNVLKNFQNIDEAFANVYRVLKPDGFLIAQLPLHSMLENFYYLPKFKRSTDGSEKETLWKFARGEPDYHPYYLSDTEWCERLERAGFRDVRVIRYVVNKHITALWDTGMRLFIKELKLFNGFLENMGALQVLRPGIIHWLMEQSIPILNYEILHQDDPDSYSFALIKATR